MEVTYSWSLDSSYEVCEPMPTIIDSNQFFWIINMWIKLHDILTVTVETSAGMQTT